MVRCIASTGGEVALSAASTKTVLQITAASNHVLSITEVSISFDGTDNVEEPIRVELVKQTTAGTATSVTPALIDGALSYTIQATASKNASAEPTTSDVLREWEVHPQTGLVYPVPDPAIFRTAASGRIGLRCITPSGVSPNCVAYIEFEE